MRTLTCGYLVYLGLSLVLLLGCSDPAQGSRSGKNNHGGGTSADAAAADSGSSWQGSTPGDASTIVGSGDPVDAAGIDSGKNPDDDTCGGDSIDTTVERTEVPGNVIVVYDKSGSMNDQWGFEADGTTPISKLFKAARAFLDAITPIADKINVGTIFFPSSNQCDVAAIDSGSQIDVMKGPDYLNAWATYWMTQMAGGRTPLYEALMQADVKVSSGTLAGTTVVLVITDGDPNCAWDPATTPALANGLAAKWLAAGVKTYVIGLPGTTGTGDAVLNGLAMAGGTTSFIKPDDSMVLQTEIAKIATETVTTKLDSCVIKLDPAPPTADKVQMIATENGKKMSVPRVLSDDAGWSITDDGSKVTLEGLLCRDAKAGRFSKISFKYGCVNLPPIEPPTPD